MVRWYVVPGNINSCIKGIFLVCVLPLSKCTCGLGALNREYHDRLVDVAGFRATAMELGRNPNNTTAKPILLPV